MSIINYFRRKKSAGLAKDRLHIIIAQQRTDHRTDYLPMLRKEILAVIAKYTHVNVENVKVDLHTKDNNSVLELNVVLPDNEELKIEATTAPATAEE